MGPEVSRREEQYLAERHRQARVAFNLLCASLGVGVLLAVATVAFVLFGKFTEGTVSGVTALITGMPIAAMQKLHKDAQRQLDRLMERTVAPAPA